MSRAHHSGDQPSQRMLRVGELIRHVVADLLARGAINDPVLDNHVVSVPEVRMSPDLKLATVYVMPLGGKDLRPVLDALDRNRKFMRGEVAHKCTLRYAPDLRFRADESFDRGARIDSILASPEVQRDLAVLGDEEEPDLGSKH
jgi:ribosome-binding factor A